MTDQITEGSEISEKLDVAEAANKVRELILELDLSCVLIVFENNRSAVAQIGLNDANPFQLFSAVKQLEIMAENLYVSDQLEQAQRASQTARLVVPRDHKRKLKPLN